jgi:DNA-directed RNA polymerase alpha subunit
MKADATYQPIEDLTDEAATMILNKLRRMGLKALTFNRFPLSRRAVNALAKNNISTVWDALYLTHRQVKGLAGCGMTTRREIFFQVQDETGIALNNWLDI